MYQRQRRCFMCVRVCECTVIPRFHESCFMFTRSHSRKGVSMCISDTCIQRMLQRVSILYLDWNVIRYFRGNVYDKKDKIRKISGKDIKLPVGKISPGNFGKYGKLPGGEIFIHVLYNAMLYFSIKTLSKRVLETP